MTQLRNRGPLLASAALAIVLALTSCSAEPAGEAAEAPAANAEASQAQILEIDPDVLEPEDERENLSGAACSPAGGCLLIGDEMRSARLFTLSGNDLVPGDELYLLPKFTDGEETKESDGEGIAFAGGHFYVIGSHSNSRMAEVQASRHFLARIAADPASGRPVELGTAENPSAKLTKVDLDYLIEQDPLLKPHLGEAAGEVPTKKNGFAHDHHGVNIEGIAVADGRTYVGFRGPLDAAGALILEIPTEPLFARGQPPARRHLVKLGDGQGIRDLAAVAGGLLILAGPEMRDPEPNPKLLFWNGSARELQPLDMPAADFGGDSPEAVAVLGETAEAWRLLILADGKAGSKPVIMRVPKR